MLFKKVTTSHIGYMLQGIEAEVKSERMKAAVNETSSPEEGWDVDFLKEAWPLPCKKIVTFPGFPDPAAYLQRPQIFLAVPPHDLGWMHFDPREVLRCQTPCLWLLELSCMDAADVLIFSCWWSQGRQGGGKPNVPKHPHQLWMNLCLESTGGREDKEFLHAMDISATYQAT
ncbi:hypothetical protein GUITHDRAFT_121694 [Guillardia theta CCMP2712]|uniref:Uncharacterized protein n=1 Tax=Guillardia theta (strain CCMP2712) TaxID=905079 RepID=L1I7Q9_GUITC|nr:hypothetical protein GUITHDRAFT_121694 [Guillardia theta CCMP2712]EKX32132.1 hypothetical protein GUITHDRAFT_121694 [Guillardia theta CCMP2712]|eukprot:XP_005819112.1 hypothetical protein GUITHDRAFT_121694 [Guillardia theta CCMP2712]